MLNKVKEKLKVTVKQLAVAFFFTSFSIFLIAVIAGKQLQYTVNIINKFAIFDFKENNEPVDIKITTEAEKTRLSEYPTYGTVWATIEIPSVNINLNVYRGEDLELLKYGAGHHAVSYFPGEGGTILIAAHNTEGFFKTLPQVKKGDEITIKAIYGTYKYKVERTEVINAKTLGTNLDINDKKETLMLYTCYPVDTPGMKSDRFVVYASLVGE